MSGSALASGSDAGRAGALHCSTMLERDVRAEPEREHHVRIKLLCGADGHRVPTRGWRKRTLTFVSLMGTSGAPPGTAIASPAPEARPLQCPPIGVSKPAENRALGRVLASAVSPRGRFMGARGEAQPPRPFSIRSDRNYSDGTHKCLHRGGITRLGGNAALHSAGFPFAFLASRRGDRGVEALSRTRITPPAATGPD